MKEQILKALETKYKNLGFSKKVFDKVATHLAESVKEETEIETAITGVEPLLKAFQPEFDKIRTERDTYKEVAEKKQADNGGEPDKTKEPENKTGEQPDISKIISEALKPFAEKLSALEGQKVQEGLTSKLLSALDGKKIPKTYYNNVIAGRQFKDEAEVETFVETIESGFAELRKEMGQEGLGEIGKPLIGGGGGIGDDKVSPEMQKLIQDRKEAAQAKATV